MHDAGYRSCAMGRERGVRRRGAFGLRLTPVTRRLSLKLMTTLDQGLVERLNSSEGFLALVRRAVKDVYRYSASSNCIG